MCRRACAAVTALPASLPPNNAPSNLYRSHFLSRATFAVYSRHVAAVKEASELAQLPLLGPVQSLPLAGRERSGISQLSAREQDIEGACVQLTLTVEWAIHVAGGEACGSRKGAL